MKYHYQEGITEKDKKGHKKGWLAFFAVIGVTVYGGFLFVNLALNGWPLDPIDKTAKLVKSVKPGSMGDYLFIPAINLSSGFNGSLKQSGSPKNNTVTVSGSPFTLAIAPGSLRSSSPFFNVDNLKEGDEIFLDNEKTRYAYRVSNTPDDEKKKLVLQGKNKKLMAEVIGTIAWQSGQPALKPL
jgi:hypothetical protein